MADNRRGPLPVGDVATGILDPVLRRKAGMSTALVQSWEEIAGPRLAASTRPEKIAWPRRAGEDDPYEPATLVIASEGASALRLQHEAGEVIARVNAFLGFGAVARIKIVQKPVAAPATPRPQLRQLSEIEQSRIARTVAGVEDEGLREALARLGKTIAGSRRR
jgi:hypothetical protein